MCKIYYTKMLSPMQTDQLWIIFVCILANYQSVVHVSVFVSQWLLFLCGIIFQGPAAERFLSGDESRIFWLSMVICEVLWFLFLLRTLFTFNLKWFVSTTLFSTHIWPPNLYILLFSGCCQKQADYCRG